MICREQKRFGPARVTVLLSVAPSNARYCGARLMPALDDWRACSKTISCDQLRRCCGLGWSTESRKWVETVGADSPRNQDRKGNIISLMFPSMKGIFRPADKRPTGTPSGPPAHANNPVIPWPCNSRGGTPTGRTEPLSGVTNSRLGRRIQPLARKDLQHAYQPSSVSCWERGGAFRFETSREVY